MGWESGVISRSAHKVGMCSCRAMVTGGDTCRTAGTRRAGRTGRSPEQRRCGQGEPGLPRACCVPGVAVHLSLCPLQDPGPFSASRNRRGGALQPSGPRRRWGLQDGTAPPAADGGPQSWRQLSSTGGGGDWRVGQDGGAVAMASPGQEILTFSRTIPVGGSEISFPSKLFRPSFDLAILSTRICP